MSLTFVPVRDVDHLMFVDDLERADDFAHSNGRVRALEQAQRAMPHDGGATMVAAMVAGWRERAERHRNSARVLIGTLRFLRLRPDVTAVHVTAIGCEFTADTARKELAHQRDRHRSCCGQMGFWLRQAAAMKLSEPATVRPDLGHYVHQLGVTELSLVIDVWDAAKDIYVASVDDRGRTLDSALIERDRVAFLLDDARRWLLVTPEAAKTWFTEALRRARLGRLLSAAE